MARKKKCERCKERDACPSNGTYCHICQQVELINNSLRYMRPKLMKFKFISDERK